MAIFDSYMPPLYETRLEQENRELRARIRELTSEIIKIELPERYIINDGATVLFWKDGTKTVVKRATDDEFNPRLAFLTAFFQHYCGMSKNKANKYLASLQIESNLGEDGKSIKNNQKSKFNIGDKVELISADGECEIYKKYIGKKGIVTNICFDKDDMTSVYAHVLFEDGVTWFPFLNNLKKIGGK